MERKWYRSKFHIDRFQTRAKAELSIFSVQDTTWYNIGIAGIWELIGLSAGRHEIKVKKRKPDINVGTVGGFTYNPTSFLLYGNGRGLK